ncbi:MAG TPA: polyprenyl diphosphate synthase [Geminicoccaceae bacterium]|jgi:undecaprenyl diphosphate synthase|nr:polyprenyl diphosphate synthase [Geminicoccaceae bacterium]
MMSRPSIEPAAPPTASPASGSGRPGLQHLAIIMDGNRRWARSRGMPPVFGHQRGAEAVRRTVEGCREREIQYLTLFAFSSENWKRPPSEVNELMNLLRFYLRREIGELARGGVRLCFLGERELMAGDIAEMMADAEHRTRHNSALRLTIALNYGSRREIAGAARRLAEQVAAGELDSADIDEQLFGQTLNSLGLPDPDLLIRTSGEQRLSNFMLWQLAYTELIFLPVHWPAFGRRHLERAIVEFERRERRYGASSA